MKFFVAKLHSKNGERSIGQLFVILGMYSAHINPQHGTTQCPPVRKTW